MWLHWWSKNRKQKILGRVWRKGKYVYGNHCCCGEAAGRVLLARSVEEDSGGDPMYSRIFGVLLSVCLHEMRSVCDCSFYWNSFYGKIASGLTGFTMSFLWNSWSYGFCCFCKLFSIYQYLSLEKHARVGIGSLSFTSVAILIRDIHCWCLSSDV